MSAMKTRVDEPLRIGVATTDITPPVGALLIGYLPRWAETVGHPLRAEAMVCRRGDDAWALITSDTVGYQREDVADIRARVQQRTGIPPEAVMVSATHTHSGPATVLRGPAKELDERYLATLPERLADLVERAWRAAAPARLETASTSAPDLLFNRRAQLPDGSWTNIWEDPEGKLKGYAEPTVLLLGTRPLGPGGTPAAEPSSTPSLLSLMVNYGCHPVTLGGGSKEISPDYPGIMRDRIEERLPGTTASFTLACAANIDPRVCCRVGSEYPLRMGEALATRVLEAIPSLAPLEPGPLGWGIEPWEMVRTKDCPAAIGRQPARRGDLCRTEVQALTAGKLMILGLPGEVFSEFAVPLRQLRADYTILVVSIANDLVGYLPTDEAQRQGAYEPTLAPMDPLEQVLLDRSAAAMARAIGRAQGAG